MAGRETTVGEYRAKGDEGPEVQIDQGGGDLGTAEHYGPAGDDSPPLVDDPCLAVTLEGETETLAAAGYSDDTDRVAVGGEKRIYARDSDGAVMGSVHLKGDDAIEIRQSAGPGVDIAADGVITIENDGGSVVIDSTGEVTVDSGAANMVVAVDGSITLSGTAGTISINPSGEISLSGVSVSLQTGESLGVHLTTLYAALLAWAPTPTDGGAALKAALAPYLAQTPPGP